MKKNTFRKLFKDWNFEFNNYNFLFTFYSSIVPALGLLQIIIQYKRFLCFIKVHVFSVCRIEQRTNDLLIYSLIWAFLQSRKEKCNLQYMKNN